MNKWRLKIVRCVILKKISSNFTKSIQKAENVIVQELQYATMKKKRKYQINKKYIMNRIEKK